MKFFLFSFYLKLQLYTEETTNREIFEYCMYFVSSVKQNHALKNLAIWLVLFPNVSLKSRFSPLFMVPIIHYTVSLKNRKYLENRALLSISTPGKPG